MEGSPGLLKSGIRLSGLIGAWALVLLATGIPLILTWSELAMAKSSNLLGTLYHPSSHISIPAYCLSASSSFVLIFLNSKLRLIRAGKKRLAAILFLTMAHAPLLACYRALIISSNNIPSEITEYFGPIRLRTIVAPGNEAPFPASCAGQMLSVRTNSGDIAKIWLGIWPFSLPYEICRDAHLDISAGPL